ncbi:hypothetical protein ACQXXP_12315 [Corynebacterium diphtheriae]
MTALKLGLCLAIVQVAMAVQIQHAVNIWKNDPRGHANSRITWANGIWICIGVFLWVFAISSALGVGTVLLDQWQPSTKPCEALTCKEFLSVAK